MWGETARALLGSFAVVALAEMGDKTQLVAFALSSRYRRPAVVMLGILVATVVNHSLAAWAGAWISTKLSASVLGWILGLGFFAFGVWTLFPDTADEPGEHKGWGPFVATAVIFFFAEMGDKTQLATVALGARFDAPLVVAAGTTLGMLAADGLAIFAGARLVTKIPMAFVRRAAAAAFFLFGLVAIVAATR